MVPCCTKNLSFLPRPLTNPSASCSAIPSLTIYALNTKCLQLSANTMLFHTSLSLFMLVLCLKLLSSLIFRTTTQSKCQHVLKSFVKEQKRPPLTKVYNFVITTINENYLLTIQYSIIPAIKGLCLILYMTLSKV